MAFNPTSAATKWANNLSNAATSGVIQEGIQSVTVAPGQAAARQGDLWATNTAAAKAKWKARVGAVSLGTWQASAITKGLPRIADGATQALPKMTAFLTALQPVIASAQASLPARGSFQQNMQRSMAMATALHNWSYTPSGS